MPLLKIQSNQAISEDQSSELLKIASNLVATELGKPESYVMVSIEPPRLMLFAGTDEPVAFLELKSIGLQESQTKQLSGALCQLMNDKLGVASDRVYIEFADAPRKMWGWNGGTF